MRTNRIKILPAAAGVLFALVAIIVLLGSWQRSQAEGGNSGPFVWQGYVPAHHIAHQMSDHLDAVADLNGNRLYVSYGYNTILRVNTVTGVVEDTLTSVFQPEWLTLSPDGERLYVSQDGSGGVISVVDTATFEVVDTLPSPGDVGNMVVGANERLYIGHSMFGSDVSVIVLDTTTGNMIGDIELTPDSIYTLALSPDGNVLYAQRLYSNGSEMDLVRLDVTGEIPVVLSDVSVPVALYSLEISPDGSFLLMRASGSKLYQYHTADLSLMRTISLDGGGSDAVINSNSELISRLWYPQQFDYGAGGIQSFDATTGELVYRFVDPISDAELYEVKRLIPLGQERMALLYENAIRILKPADYGLALPVIPSQYCSSFNFDDFSDPNSGWPSGQLGTITYGYQDDQYRVYHQDAGQWFGVTADHFWHQSELLKVEGRVLDGRIGVWGLVFGLNNDWSEFYTLEIVPTHQLWFIWHYTDAAGWQPIVYQGVNTSINTNGWNTLEIRDNGPDMALAVNGSIYYFAQKSGRVGIAGGSLDGLLDIRYDNYLFVGDNCPFPRPLPGVDGPAVSTMTLERPLIEIPVSLP